MKKDCSMNPWHSANCLQPRTVPSKQPCNLTSNCFHLGRPLIAMFWDYHVIVICVFSITFKFKRIQKYLFKETIFCFGGLHTQINTWSWSSAQINLGLQATGWQVLYGLTINSFVKNQVIEGMWHSEVHLYTLPRLRRASPKQQLKSSGNWE